jgi:glutamyl-tRNA synthetase
LEPEKAAQVLQALPALKERAKTLNDLIDGAEFVLAKRPMPVEAAAAAVLDAGARRTLAAILPSLATLPDWSAQATETAVKAFAGANGIKLGNIAQPLRAALTGRTTSPGIFEVLAILGREESLARITDQATS